MSVSESSVSVHISRRLTESTGRKLASISAHATIKASNAQQVMLLKTSASDTTVLSTALQETAGIAATATVEAPPQTMVTVVTEGTVSSEALATQLPAALQKVGGTRTDRLPTLLPTPRPTPLPTFLPTSMQNTS